MNTKLLLFLTCFAAVTLTASAVTAGPRGGGGGMGRGSGGAHFSSMPARGGQTFSRGFRGFNNRGFHNRTFNNRVVFIGGFGFPWWWGWGWGWGYPYGYYGYGYGYPYGDGYGYQSGYDSNNYGSSYGGTGYGSDYPTHSRVAELQRRLAQAGYYHGAIDGILGPATRRALREYERTHNQSAYGMTDRY